MVVAGLFGVSFLTPLAALFAFAAAIPLAAVYRMEARSRQVRLVLGARGPDLRALAPVVLAIALLPVLVGVAAAQPVIVRHQLVDERRDAQALFVFDTSRSMVASDGPGRPTRLDRAKEIARKLQASLGDVPVGIVSMTDRALPDLMPTTDRALFSRTLAQSVRVDAPPPDLRYARRGRSTNLTSLGLLLTTHVYSQHLKHRLLVVFTDGEIEPVDSHFRSALRHRIAPLFVHVWAPNERIFTHGDQIDPNYHPDPQSGALLATAAEVTGGAVVDEDRFGSLEAASLRILGHGPSSKHISAYERIPLAPWFALACILPLVFLLWRRNA
jgi:hypothetical protein